MAWFKKNLMDFTRLAVREEGAKLIKSITGKDAYVMIDPTLMLDVSERQKLTKKPLQVDTTIKHAFVYVLGNITNEMKRDIDLLKRKNTEIII